MALQQNIQTSKCYNGYLQVTQLVHHFCITNSNNLTKKYKIY